MRNWFVLLAFISLVVTSCMPEQQLAIGFTKKMPGIDLQLITPEMVFKYNHRGEEIPDLDSLSPGQQDSALFADSRYIRFVDDSIFSDLYINNFIDELRALGFTVYLENGIDSVLMTKPQAYVVNMAQVQLDEYMLPFEDSEPFFDTVYYKKFQLNAVDASSWFELSKLNAPKPGKTVLFSEFTASDGLDGRFSIDPFTNAIRYKYKIDSLKVKDLYELASYAGKKNASYLYDFFMNQFVIFHMPMNEEPYDYFHYNRFRKMVVTAGEERFQILDGR